MLTWSVITSGQPVIRPATIFLKQSKGRPILGVQLVEPKFQIPQCLVCHDVQRMQRVVTRNALLGIDVTEHIQL
jgi:hypothetical protein